ncbi:MAG: hypothetical protein JWO52_5193 [Gammaproteobacteria bacterium]|nr:hypothetical protein [Gammaproteobacteria bacterium]
MPPIDLTAAAVLRTAAASLMLAVAGTLLSASEVRAKPPARACRSSRYTVVELPFLPGVISPSGVVAGITEAHRAVVWRRESGTRELAVPEGFHYTEPVAITRSGGLVVNAFDAQTRVRRAFVYSNSSVTALPGNQTFAHGVSPSGLIVGEWVPDGKTRSDAVYWDNSGPHSIGLCCGGTIKAANKTGYVIGDAYDVQGRYHAFVWNPSHGQRRVGPAEAYSSAVAINAAGHVLLQVGSDGYLDQAGSLQRLELSSKFSNSVRAMNDCDFVAGGYGPDSDHDRAFVWTSAGGFQDLNSLIPGDSGWTLESATAINDRGEIVGRGDFHHDDDRGFLLIPQWP